jgi:hypothetical protein
MRIQRKYLLAVTVLIAAGTVWWFSTTRVSPEPAVATPKGVPPKQEQLAQEEIKPISPPSTVAVVASALPMPPSLQSTAPISVPVISKIPVTQAQVPAAIATAKTIVNEEQVIGTRRMYIAHAPLRVPEVADPDSAGNRRILQTMVTKALSHPATPAPAASSN